MQGLFDHFTCAERAGRRRKLRWQRLDVLYRHFKGKKKSRHSTKMWLFLEMTSLENWNKPNHLSLKNVILGKFWLFKNIIQMFHRIKMLTLQQKKKTLHGESVHHFFTELRLASHDLKEECGKMLINTSTCCCSHQHVHYNYKLESVSVLYTDPCLVFYTLIAD